VTVKVLLTGSAIPDAQCVHEVVDLDDKVKIAHGAGYEHFANSGEVREVDGVTVPVYQWCEKTRMAE